MVTNSSFKLNKSKLKQQEELEKKIKFRKTMN